jgi:hypothetical protein
LWRNGVRRTANDELANPSIGDQTTALAADFVLTTVDRRTMASSA